MASKSNQKRLEAVGGMRAVFGCTHEALALFRISLGVLLVTELVTRFRYLHPFYSDEGTLPLGLLLPKIDELYKAVSLHVHLHELWQVQLVLGFQVVAAALFTIGFQTRLMSCISWYLYLSLTLRNTWLNFILDRYFHYLLFYSMLLPLDRCWSVSTLTRNSQQRMQQKPNEIVVSAATVALKLLVFWIYLDAGGGKYLDPLQGWTYNAKPLPALDTYTRHTTFARYLYAILGPEGLRAMTPTVVWVELLAAPVAFLGSFFGSASLVKFAIWMVWQLHIGIALSMNNAFLLSLIACTPWFVFYPVGWENVSATSSSATSAKFSFGSIFSTIIILSMIAGNLWFETISESCDQTIFYSTIFHCRWNVFVGAEEYVTWEIAPGELADGSIVDVWGRKDEVSWSLPGAGAPCTSTARPGRWRSYPYLAELDGEDGEVLWSYLCKQWDRENQVDRFPERKLKKFNFFMLQADVLPNMAFSATRKRLIHSHDCLLSEQGGSNFDTEKSLLEVKMASANAQAQHDHGREEETAISPDDNVAQESIENESETFQADPVASTEETTQSNPETRAELAQSDPEANTESIQPDPVGSADRKEEL